MLIEANPYKVFAGSKGEAIAKRICDHLGCELGKMSISRFSDGEFAVSFEESVRGQSVYLVQSTVPTTDNLMELMLMIDAARRASAYKVIAVVPYFGWARQDRKDRPRVSIGAKVVANMLQGAGADRVITVDLHADQIQGFFDVPVDHVYAQSIFLPYIKKLHLKNLSIAAPDMGGAKKANSYAKKIGCPMIICHKTRAKANVIESITAIGEVKGRDIVIVDDMIDTAGTLCAASNVLMEMGASSVRACASHGVLSGKAIENIENSALKEVIITDTIPSAYAKAETCKKISVLSIAPLFAEVINSVYNNISIGPIFQRENF